MKKIVAPLFIVLSILYLGLGIKQIEAKTVTPTIELSPTATPTAIPTVVEIKTNLVENKIEKVDYKVERKISGIFSIAIINSFNMF